MVQDSYGIIAITQGNSEEQEAGQGSKSRAIAWVNIAKAAWGGQPAVRGGGDLQSQTPHTPHVHEASQLCYFSDRAPIAAGCN